MAIRTSSSEDLIERMWLDSKGLVLATQSLPVISRFLHGRPTTDEYCYFLLQDYLYLNDYGKALELVALKASDDSMISEFIQSAKDSLMDEKAFIFDEALRMGCNKDQIAKGRKMPATQAYGDFLVRTASQESLAETIAIFLVCNMSFHEIGKMGRRSQSDAQKVVRWTDRYSSSEMITAVEKYKVMFTHVLEKFPPHSIDRIAVVFQTALHYEYRFWYAVEYKEKWPNF